MSHFDLVAPCESWWSGSGPVLTSPADTEVHLMQLDKGQTSLSRRVRGNALMSNVTVQPQHHACRLHRRRAPSPSSAWLCKCNVKWTSEPPSPLTGRFLTRALKYPHSDFISTVTWSKFVLIMKLQSRRVNSAWRKRNRSQTSCSGLWLGCLDVCDGQSDKSLKTPGRTSAVVGSHEVHLAKGCKALHLKNVHLKVLLQLLLKQF